VVNDKVAEGEQSQPLSGKRGGMNREDIDKVGLGQPESESIVTNKPMNIPVIGFPEHLEAKIVGAYQYQLSRKGDVLTYKQSQTSPTPEAALQALKRLLNWDPV
jgi:hypothetical protein